MNEAERCDRVHMNDFALSLFPKGDPAGCFVTLAGPREEISGYILVSKSCNSLAEFINEIERLKRELDDL
jgi:hypothetical protein